MADNTADEILNKMKTDEEKLIDDGMLKYLAEKNSAEAQAEANAAAESIGGSADYQNYNTPNGIGIQADAISRLGLDKGRLSDTNQSRGYNAYQSRLSAAENEARKAKEQLKLSYDVYNAQLEAAKRNANANYYAMKNSDFWKQGQWDYQLAADKKADELNKK